MAAQINKNKTNISPVNSRANFPMSFLNLIFIQSIKNFISVLYKKRKESQYV